MRSLVRHFTVKRHEEHGHIGLAPQWMPQGLNDPLTGMASAHDMLEHGMHDVTELQGLGGAVYVRGLTDYWSRKGNLNHPAVHIASDFLEIFTVSEGEWLPRNW